MELETRVRFLVSDGIVHLTAFVGSTYVVAPMTKARYFEIGVDCLEIIAVLLALLVAVYVSIWTALLLLVVLLLGLVSRIGNFDGWIVRRLSTRDNPLILPLCKTGFVGRHRRMLRLLPSDPRCRFCMVPFGVRQSVWY